MPEMRCSRHGASGHSSSPLPLSTLVRLREQTACDARCVATVRFACQPGGVCSQAGDKLTQQGTERLISETSTEPHENHPPECWNALRTQNTAESCACASDSAHSLKYDAVFDTAPRTNSIVWMAWWMKASPKENSGPWPSP